MRGGVVVAVSLAPATRGDAQRSVALTNVALIDAGSAVARPKMTVLVRGSRIVAVAPADRVSIPPDAQVINGRGKWLVPGLIDVHSHTSDRQTLRQALSFGITTIHVMPGRPDTTLALELWSSVAETPAPRMLLTQFFFTTGFPETISPGAWVIRTPATPEEARAMVDEIRGRGFRHLRLFLDAGSLWWVGRAPMPVLPPDVIRAIVERAHELRMRVYVHAFEAALAREAIDAGVDALLHPVADSVVRDDSFWTPLRLRRIGWTPTAAVLMNFGDHGGLARRVLADSLLTRALSAEDLASLRADSLATSFPESAGDRVHHQRWARLHATGIAAALTRRAWRARKTIVAVTGGRQGGFAAQAKRSKSACAEVECICWYAARPNVPITRSRPAS